MKWRREGDSWMPPGVEALEAAKAKALKEHATLEAAKLEALRAALLRIKNKPSIETIFKLVDNCEVVFIRSTLKLKYL